MAKSPSTPQPSGLERILCHLVEARDAAIGAGLPVTTEAVERAIIVAALESSSRRGVAYLRVVNGPKLL